LGLLAAVVIGACGETRGVVVTRSPGSLGTADGGAIRAAGPDWPTLLHNASHSGASTVAGPSGSTIRWQRRLEGPIVAGPVSARRVAYVASTAGVLHAIGLTSGRDVWTFDGRGHYGSDLSTSSTVLGDGTILWPGPRNKVFAVSPAGHLRWTLTSPDEPLTPVVDAAGGRLVVADTSGNLTAYRLRSDGRAPVRQWTRSLGTVSYGNPAIGSDGTIYETAGNSLFAVAADGRTRWEVRTTQLVEVSAAIAADGTVVFGSNDLLEYGVTPNGTVLWRHEIGTFTYSSPVTLPGNRVVYGNHHGQMTTVDTRDGHVISTDLVPGKIWTSAAVDVHGDVYFASRSGGIYGFGPTGRRLFAIQAGGTFDSYPAIASNGTLLVGGDDGVLRAIG